MVREEKERMDSKKVSVLALILLLASTISAGFEVRMIKAPATMLPLLATTSQYTASRNQASYSITLITGDVVTVACLPDGEKGISIVPANPKLNQNFLTYETPRGTYVIPNGVNLEKLDMELFNVDYLAKEGYPEAKELPVIISLSDASEQSIRPFERQVMSWKGTKNAFANGPSVMSAKLALNSIQDETRVLLSEPHVKKVWLDKKVHIKLSDSVPLIGAPQVWASGYNGTGVEIAILDTGIDKTHPDLDDLDDNSTTTDPKVVREVNFSDDLNTLDYQGHGTHCAGIAAGTGAASGGKNKGVAPGAKLWSVKVLNAEGWGYESWVISGVEYAAYGPDGLPNTGDEADIISMSLGGDITDGTDPLSLAVDAAVDAGVVVVVSAGNDGPESFTVHSPGVARKPITVGASDGYNALPWFSSRGPTIDFRVKPDVLAPGVNINSTVPYGFVGKYYDRKSGTSMAAPHVAGTAALMLQACQKMPSGWAFPKYVKNTLISTARDLGYTVYEQGGGRIDVPYAVSTDVMVDPATLSFSFSSESVSESAMITFYNLNATSNRVLSLNTIVRDVITGIPVDCATLNTTALSISPDSNASVLLTFDTTIPRSTYSGMIVASTDTGKALHVIFGFVKLCKVTITKTNWHGFPARNDPVGVIGDPGFPDYTFPETDANGNVTLYLAAGTYHIYSVGYNLLDDAFIFTMAENVTITGESVVHLDERTTKAIDLDPNKPGQKIAHKEMYLVKKGKIAINGWWIYPKTALQYVSPTTFKTTFNYEYYPIEYYHESNWLYVESPEWHNLIYSLERVTENTTFTVDYSTLVQRTTDYKTATMPYAAKRVEFACHPNQGGMYMAEAWFITAPKRIIQWLSPEPAYYLGFFSDEADRWGYGIWDSDWSTSLNRRSYQAGTNPYYAVGEHPLASGTKIYLGNSHLTMNGTISTDTFGNQYWSRSGAGNITILEDGVEVYRKEISDKFNESVPFSGTPRFTAIIEGESTMDLSTRTLTSLTFTANAMQDYKPPQVTIRAEESNLDSTVPQGKDLVDVSVLDESPVTSVGLEYSIDDGATWIEAGKLDASDNVHQFSLSVLEKHDFVSLRVNATDSVGNSISRTIIRGFYVAPYGDMALTNTALSKTATLQGYSILVSATVENQWLFTESVNVTVYCNETAITLPDGKNYTTITLDGGSQMTITVPWATAGFSKGKYSVSVYAWPIPGETDTEDNTYAAGTVYIVGILGDISGPSEVPDGKVDIQDIARVSGAFGTYPSNPRWNPNADISSDGRVDITDVAIVASNFGKIDP